MHVVNQCNIAPGEDVVVRDSLMNSRVVIAGLVAPVFAGATTVFPDEKTTGGIGVGSGVVPESRQIDLKSIW